MSLLPSATSCCSPCTSSTTTTTNISDLIDAAIGNRLGVVNVKEYGAVGDGTTDDTEAIQSVIDDTQSDILIPDGTFSLTGLTINRPVWIYGLGTIKALTYVGGPTGLIVIDSSDVTLSNLTIDCAELANRAINIESGNSKIRLENLTITDVKQSASETDDNCCGIRIEEETEDISIIDCNIDGVTAVAGNFSRGIAAANPAGSGSYCRNLKIRGGSIKNIGADGATEGDAVVIQNFTEPCHAVISGVYVENCSQRAFKIMSPGVKIIGCTVKGWGTDGGNSAISFYASECSAIGNHLLDLRYFVGIEAGSGLASVTNIVIQGNTIETSDGFDTTSSGDGVLIDGLTSTGIVINSNNIRRVRFGVRLHNSASHFSVVGNSIRTATSSGVAIIEKDGQAPSEGTVSANVFSDITQYGVRISVGSTETAQNISVFGNEGSAGFGLVGVADSPNAVEVTRASTGLRYGVSPISGYHLFQVDETEKARVDQYGIGTPRIGIGPSMTASTDENLPVRVLHTIDGEWNVEISNLSTHADAFGAVTLKNSTGYAQFALFSDAAASLAGRGYLVTAPGSGGWTYNTLSLTGTHDFLVGSTTVAQFDRTSDADATRLLIFDVNSATLRRVKVGANNSGPGGTGRALYVDNA